MRARQGKRTKGHCGDIAATCAEGEFVTSKITIELKRGYNKVTLADVLDRPENLKQQGLEAFFEQAITAAVNAGTDHWMLVHKRDGREPIVYLPGRLYGELFPEVQVGNQLKIMAASPIIWSWVIIRWKNGKRTPLRVAAMHWREFLKSASPEDVKLL